MSEIEERSAQAFPLWARLERRYAWSFLGFVVGVFGIALGILALRERRPEITFSFVAESNVLDVHTPVSALDVLYRGKNIQKLGLNLRIITVRIENTGAVDI